MKYLRKICILLSFILVFNIGFFSLGYADNYSSDKNKIISLLKTQTQAVNKKDLTAYMKLYNPKAKNYLSIKKQAENLFKASTFKITDISINCSKINSKSAVVNQITTIQVIEGTIKSKKSFLQHTFAKVANNWYISATKELKSETIPEDYKLENTLSDTTFSQDILNKLSACLKDYYDKVFEENYLKDIQSYLTLDSSDYKTVLEYSKDLHNCTSFTINGISLQKAYISKKGDNSSNKRAIVAIDYIVQDKDKNLIHKVDLIGLNFSNEKWTIWAYENSNKEEINLISSNNKIQDVSLSQFEQPQKGEEIAVMTTNMGTIKIRLFPEYAPKAVENFKKHVSDGYYNNLTFHRVIKDFMIQGGDPKGDGTGGESIWNKPFENEFSKNLYNFRGALSMANSGPNTNGSQFFIVQNSKVNPLTLENKSLSNNVLSKYLETGGAPWLDNNYTVFGQVFEGMDVVDKIAQVKTNSSDKPIEDVKIIKIEIVKY